MQGANEELVASILLHLTGRWDAQVVWYICTSEFENNDPYPLVKQAILNHARLGGITREARNDTMEIVRTKIKKLGIFSSHHLELYFRQKNDDFFTHSNSYDWLGYFLDLQYQTYTPLDAENFPKPKQWKRGQESKILESLPDPKYFV